MAHLFARRRALHDILLSVADEPLAGLVLGYGAIATDDIDDGLALLRRCF
jgi:hypothetical protein